MPVINLVVPVEPSWVEDLKGLVQSSFTDAQLEAFLNDAYLMVQGCASIAAMDTTRQTAIIKYVAAHLVSTMAKGHGNRFTTQRSLGDASESYAAPVLGMGLQGTTFGQMAIALDPSGCLGKIGKTRATLTAIRNK